MHLDADAFFASCETASNPELAGLPVAVGGLHRGIIASANYEARRQGVFTPMPTATAIKVCPSLVVISGNREKYEDFSQRMFSIVEHYTPFVEKTSLDEGYGDLSGIPQDNPSLVVKEIQDRIFQELRISVSVGLAPNKLLSAIASKLHKPKGLVEVPHGSERDFISKLGVEWLPGIGPGNKKKLATHGIESVEDILSAPPSTLKSVLGSLFSQTLMFASGHDPRPMALNPNPAKSYSRQETFSRNTVDRLFVKKITRGMLDDLMQTLRGEGKTTQHLSIFARASDWTKISRGSRLPEPTNLETDIYETCDRLLALLWAKPFPLRMVGVRLSQVQLASLINPATPDLFSAPAAHRRQNLIKKVDEINKIYGSQTVIRGHRL